MLRTMAGVSAAAETLKIFAPACRRASKSVSARATVTDGDVDRLSDVLHDGVGRRRVEHDARSRLHLGEHGEVDHALALREAAADAANTGISAASSSACVMIGCGVNG